MPFTQKGSIMIKETIALHDDTRFPLSLRALPLTPDCGGRIEYLFYSVNIARDFDDLTSLLERVLDCPFAETGRDEKRIFYEVTIDGKPYCLMFKVGQREDAAKPVIAA